MKKLVEGKQCTIIWHVDDLKMLNVNSGIVSSVLSDIGTEYGEILKMTIMQGKLHKYLGMTIDYSSPEKIIFSMVNYIVKMLNCIP